VKEGYHKRGSLKELYHLITSSFIERGIPVFGNLNEALNALGHLNAYYDTKGSDHE
jgi:hypothetical protein